MTDLGINKKKIHSVLKELEINKSNYYIYDSDYTRQKWAWPNSPVQAQHQKKKKSYIN